MPFIPNFIERLLLLSLNVGPSPLLDVASGVALRSLAIAIKMGLFERLEKQALTALELANEVKAS